jgi:hypothetical protein
MALLTSPAPVIVLVARVFRRGGVLLVVAKKLASKEASYSFRLASGKQYEVTSGISTKSDEI